MASGFVYGDIPSLYGFSLFEFGPPAVYPMDGRISILLAGSDGRKMEVHYSRIYNNVQELFVRRRHWR